MAATDHPLVNDPRLLPVLLEIQRAITQTHRMRSFEERLKDVQDIVQREIAAAQATPAGSAVALLHSIREQAATGAYLVPDDQRFFDNRCTATDADIRARILIERAIVRQAVSDILAAGLRITLTHEGDDSEAVLANDLDFIMDQACACDLEGLVIFTAEGNRVGWVQMVYGNDGWDVLSDNSTTVSHYLDGADALSQELADAMDR